MRRDWYMHLAVFGICYAGFLAYLQYTSPRKIAASQTVSLQRIVEDIRSLPTAATPGADAVMPQNISPPTLRTASLPVNMNRTEAPLPPPDEVFVPDYSSPQAHITSLERAVQFDEHAANRLSAIATLRQQAADGDTDGSVAEALRAATMDEDASVRSAAQAAYNEIMASKQVR